jgi:succinyl-diaminopimelate desuccinylase
VPEVAERLARRTLELIEIPSVSGHEAAILSHLVALVGSSGLAAAEETEAGLLLLPARRGPEAPLVLLAGHVDTVPEPDGLHGRIEDGWVVGRGASDMKGALAVMLEVASALGEGRFGSSLDVGWSCSDGRSCPAPRMSWPPCSIGPGSSGTRRWRS